MRVRFRARHTIGAGSTKLAAMTAEIQKPESSVNAGQIRTRTVLRRRKSLSKEHGLSLKGLQKSYEVPDFGRIQSEFRHPRMAD
jgi:hypothetical protein